MALVFITIAAHTMRATFVRASQTFCTSISTRTVPTKLHATARQQRWKSRAQQADQTSSSTNSIVPDSSSMDDRLKSGSSADVGSPSNSTPAPQGYATRSTPLFQLRRQPVTFEAVDHAARRMERDMQEIVQVWT